MGSTERGQEVPRLPLKTVGPYQLMAQLGQTAHGPVYVARLPGNEAVFALKLFRGELSSEEVARIRHEIQSVTRLEHPGIARPIDVGMERTTLYVVTEHVAGMTLQEQLSKRGPLSSQQAAELVVKLAEIVQTAHEAGVIHGDLKPGNVLIDGRNGEPLIQDFGLGPAYDMSGKVRGSTDATRPLYQAPEQVRGERGDARTDVYGLGAVLFELLTCTPPFGGRSRQELCDNILAGSVDPPRELAAGVDPRVEALCLKALSVDPRKRPASAGALARALRRTTQGALRASRLALALAGLIWLLTVSIPIAWAVRERRDRVEAVDAADGELSSTRERLKAAEGLVELKQRGVESERRLTTQSQEEARRLSEVVSRLRQSETESLARVEALQNAIGQIAAPSNSVAVALEEIQDELRDGGDALELRVRLHFDVMRPDLAEALLSRARQERGSLSPQLLLWSWYVFKQQGKTVAADNVLAELAALPEGTPEREFAHLLSDNSLATIPRLSALVAAAPESFFIRLAQAQVLFQRASRDVAALPDGLSAANALVGMDPINPEARMLRARIGMLILSQDRNRHDLAGQILTDMRHAQAFGQLPAYYVASGQFYLTHLGNQFWPHALGDLLQAQRLAQQRNSLSDLVGANTWLGNLGMLLHEPDRALQHWQAAVRYTADQPQSGMPWLIQAAPYMAGLSEVDRRAVLGKLPGQLQEDMLNRIMQSGQRR